jgi:hypothetical protein
MTLNAAARCAPLIGVSAGQHLNEQAADVAVDDYGSVSVISSALRPKAGPDLRTGLLRASHCHGVQPPAPLVPGKQMSASAGLLSRGNGRPAWDAVVKLDADCVVDSGRHVIEADEHEEFEDFLRGPACGQLCPGRIGHAAVGVQLVG